MALEWKQVYDLACIYIKHNFSVFPVHTIVNNHCSCGVIDCKRPGKHPAVAWKSAASIDFRRITEWWNEKSDPVYNIGIATGKLSNITVVDVDVKTGGLESWQKICEAYEIPDTFTVNTGGGGFHLYFKYQPGIKTGTNLLGAGIDIRNDGGYVIAPPSIHASGGTYQAANPNTLLSDIQPWPDALTEVYNNKGNFFKDTNKKSAKALQGAQHITLEKAAKLLDFIDADDYQTWLNVGVILGREFNRSDDAWRLYNAWADKYDGDKGDQRNNKMQEAFFTLSQQEPPPGRAPLAYKTLFNLAIKNGYTEGRKTVPVNLLCYIAEENAFLYLLNGAKWTATAVNNMCMPVEVDGDMMKPAEYLLANHSANSVVNSALIPAGLVEDVDVRNGLVHTLPGAFLANIFDKNVTLPAGAEMKGVPEPQEPTKATSGEQSTTKPYVHTKPAGGKLFSANDISYAGKSDTTVDVSAVDADILDDILNPQG